MEFLDYLFPYQQQPWRKCYPRLCLPFIVVKVVEKTWYSTAGTKSRPRRDDLQTVIKTKSLQLYSQLWGLQTTRNNKEFRLTYNEKVSLSVVDSDPKCFFGSVTQQFADLQSQIQCFGSYPPFLYRHVVLRSDLSQKLWAKNYARERAQSIMGIWLSTRILIGWKVIERHSGIYASAFWERPADHSYRPLPNDNFRRVFFNRKSL